MIACKCGLPATVAKRYCPACYVEGRPLDTLTYSQLSTFLGCRKKAWWRYERGLAPKKVSGALRLGTVVHKALEAWFSREPLEAVLEAIPRFPRDQWQLATAMLRGYAARYGPAEQDEFSVTCVEELFSVPILNPETSYPSRSFCLRGKVDGLVRLRSGEVMILEHKTAASISGTYLEKLWTDFQNLTYVHALRLLGQDVRGVIYDILAKAALKQREGETEEAFAERAAALAAKNKSGKTTAKRQEAETDEAFQARLTEWYAQPEAFHRELLFFEERRFAELQAELWELQREYAHARSQGVWPRNPGTCFSYNSPCPYFALCAGGEAEILMSQYEQRQPHEELVVAANQEVEF